jgi:putative aldouronate transport system substrate-binding protein
MRRKIRSLVSIGMAVGMLSSIAAGCGKAKETDKSSDKTQKEVKKPEKIRFMSNMGFSDKEDQDAWASEFKKLTGIEMELMMPPTNQYSEKLDLSFASGDAPDVAIMGQDVITKYATQGGLYDVSKLVEESSIMKGLDSKIIDSSRLNGKLYALPYEDGGGAVTYMRKDWLDKLGKKLPTTYDEFYDVLKSFKTLGDDVIPFTAPGLTDSKYIRQFYQSAVPDFKQQNGKWVDGFQEPDMAAALSRMRQAYQDGVMDKEIVTNKTTTCRDKWTSGRAGVFAYWAGDWATTLANGVKSGPAGNKAELVIAPAIKDAKYEIRVRGVMAITSKSQNPEGVFKYFVEYMNDGKEGSMLFRHGVENKHYEKKSSGEIVPMTMKNASNQVYTKAFVSPSFALNPITISGYSHNMDEKMTSSAKMLKDNGEIQVILPVSKTLNKINADLVALRQQTVSKAVLGQMSVQEALENYKKEATNLGIENVMTELNDNK